MVQHPQGPERGWEQWRHRNDPPAPALPRPDPLQYRVPVVLGALGLAAMLVGAVFLQARPATLERVLIIGFILLIDIPITLVGMQVLGRFFGVPYGGLLSAVLKLLSIALFLEGVVFVGSLLTYPITVRILLFPVSWYLLAWLFDLNGRDLVCTIFGLWVFHLVLWLTFFLVRPPLDPSRLPARQLDVPVTLLGASWPEAERNAGGARGFRPAPHGQMLTSAASA